MGYEAAREQTLARQIQMGIVPADTQLPPLNPIGTAGDRTGPDGKPFPELEYTKPWDSLSADEKRLFARMAEVYAGFLSHADHHIGRLLDFLEESGQAGNTLVILVSDNGASGEGGPNGSVNENKLFNGIPDDMASNLAMISELGSTKTYNHYPTGWAMAFNTPIDIVPTILDCLGVTAPETIKGHTQSHFDGLSMRYCYDDPSAPSVRRTQFYSMLGSRARCARWSTSGSPRPAPTTPSRWTTGPRWRCSTRPGRSSPARGTATPTTPTWRTFPSTSR